MKNTVCIVLQLVKQCTKLQFFEKIALKRSTNAATQKSYANNMPADVSNTSISNESYKLELQEHKTEVEDGVKKEITEVCELIKVKGTETKSSEEVLKAFRF